MAGPRIAIVGSGSIGLYYGAKLAAAGHDVHFLLRGGFEEAAHEGIRVYDDGEATVHLPHPQIYRESSAIGPVDLVIISLKTTSNSSLPAILPPLLGEDTAVITLQNGLGNEEFLASLVGAGRVLGALCFICLTRRTLASVDHVGKDKLSIGEYGRAPLERTRRFVEIFRSSGVRTELVENLGEERWRKLVWNIPFNGLAVARGGVPVDEILAAPDGLAECRALMAETIEAANAVGFPIEASYADWQIERTYPMGPYRPSTLIDFQAGSPLEIEPIWGEPLRRARQAGLAVPHLSALYEQLLAVGSPHRP